VSDANDRRPWSEGPAEEAPPESWLTLDDDPLLHKIETFDAAEEGHDERLLEVVASDRHFFIRQEAAKRIKDRNKLFEFEDDRHVGQILVRHLTRREDVTYLERLCAVSKHVEVRSAAQVQLARLWKRLDAPEPDTAPHQAVKLTPEARAATGLAVAPEPAKAPAPAAPAAPAKPARAAKPAKSAEPVTSAALEKGAVDGSLMAWAVHFLVQPLWTHLGTRGTRELLSQTRRELRLPSDAVAAVASWMVAFHAAVRGVAPSVEIPSARVATSMMADALRDAGFYAAFDAADAEAHPGR
jgi:hypothetical protein